MTKAELEELGFAFDNYWDHGSGTSGILLAEYGSTTDPRLFGQGARYAGRDKEWHRQPMAAGRAPFRKVEDAIAFATEVAKKDPAPTNKEG